MPQSALYDRDFYAWANEQAALLREGKLAQADIEHIAEEIESMGRTEKRELISRLTVLLLHLLKWRFQPALRGNSWRNSIRIQRREIAAHLADNPSLKAVLPSSIEQAYGTAVIEAETETGLDAATFPIECPWSFEQITNSDFWPE
jgi:ribosomal protein L29